MEKKILSIDFDIIMAPSIELYNDYAFAETDPAELWADLEAEYQFEFYDKLQFDETILYGITDLLKHFKDKPIYFITDHDEVVDILKKSPNYNIDIYNIYNVDFHHDFWYDKLAFNEILQQDEYNCGTWLGYLYLTKKLSSVTWVKALHSDAMSFRPYGNDNCKINLESIRNIEKLKDIDFDEVYFCLSPQWIPPRYVIFYNLIKQLLEEEK